MSFEPVVLFFVLGVAACLLRLIDKIVGHLRDNYGQNYGLLMVNVSVGVHRR